MTTLHDAVNDTLYRLDDETAAVWTRDEIELHVKDGYNALCRRTRCLFDIKVIENVPPTGNYGNDLQRYLAEQTPGMNISDRRLHATGYDEDLHMPRSLSTPTSGTHPTEGADISSLRGVATMPTAPVPEDVVNVLRVSWNRITLVPTNTRQLRQMDTQFEITSGDPRWWAWDRDGLLIMRFYPVPTCDATYNTVSGVRGTLKFTDESGVTVNGSRGVLRERVGSFPSGGPRGVLRQRHPVERNFSVEVARLGRPLRSHSFEIPRAYVKYVVFFAMSRALEHEGPGQDRRLSSHYMQRFELGVERMEQYKRNTNRERIGVLGKSQEPPADAFGLGMPALPSSYGRAYRRKVSGGY